MKKQLSLEDMQPMLRKTVTIVRASDFDLASVMNDNERKVFDQFVEQINTEKKQ